MNEKHGQEKQVVKQQNHSPEKSVKLNLNAHDEASKDKKHGNEALHSERNQKSTQDQSKNPLNH